MGKLLSTADGEHDARGNIVIEDGSSEDNRLRSGGLKPEEYAARVMMDVMVEGETFASAVSTAMIEAPEDDAKIISDQVRNYLIGFYNVALAEARKAIARVDGE